MRFLIVEDRAKERAWIAQCLQRHFAGLQLTPVANAAELERALEQGSFDLVLTDDALGWTDGLQVLRQVQARFPEVPVVMVTESGSEEMAVEGMRAGLGDYLLKQHADRLPAVVRASLDRARLQQDLDRSRREMEARVQERTAELTQANERLRRQNEELQAQEQALREGKAELQSTMDATPALISYVDTRFCCRRVNRTAERWLGLSKQEMEGHPLPDFLGAAAWEAIRPYAERALGGETVIYEQELPYEPGGPRWVRATYTPDRDETGQVQGFIAHLLDIGERRRVEAELQRSEEKYRHLVRYAPALIWEVDFRGPRFTLVNDALCEYLGYTREELLAINPFDLMDEESRAVFRWRIQQWLRGEKPKDSVEYRGQAKDGREVCALLNVTFTIDEQGKPLGATVVGQDITARQQAEREREQLLEQQEDLLVQQEQLLEETQRQAAVLEATLAALTEGVLVRDLQGNVVRKNAVAERMLGYTPEEWRRSPREHLARIELRLPGQERAPQVDELPFARALRGETVDGMLMTIRLPGADRPTLYLTSAAPVRLPDGTIIGTVTTTRDVSQLRAVQTQLEEANAALQQRNEELEIQSEKLQMQTEELEIQTEELRQQTEELQANEAALQEALHQAEAGRQLLEALLEYIPAGITIGDAEGNIQRVSRFGQESLGGTVQGRIATTATENTVYHPDGITPMLLEELPLVRATRKGEVVKDLEMIRITAQGRRLALLCNAGPIRDAAGRVVGGITVWHDITERRQVERELFAVHQRLEALMNALPVGVGFSNDPTNQQATGNPALLEQFEITPADNISASAPDPTVAGRQVRYFCQGCEVAGADLPLQRAVAEGHSVPPRELEILLPSGRRWFAMVSGAPLRDQAGRITGGVSVIMDITDRKRAEEERERLLAQARQDAETKSALLREVNHRVKNNLAAIVGLLYAQQDRSRATIHPEYRALVRDLTKRIEGLSIVHGLLSRSLWAPLRVDELAEKVLDGVLQMAPIGKVAGKVAAIISPSPLLVSPDQAQTLALVLNELALNVVKHASTDTSIRVHLDIAREDQMMVLTMRDNGPGYPEEVLAGQQAGMGLELLRHLVCQNLRGQLALRNKGGAVAEIRFSLDEAIPAGGPHG